MAYKSIGDIVDNIGPPAQIAHVSDEMGAFRISGFILKAPFLSYGKLRKIRAASTEMLKLVKRFGSGSGHWPLFCVERIVGKSNPGQP